MVDIQELCMGCMEKNKDYEICPLCGFDNTQKVEDKYLPLRYILQGRYVIGKVLSENGESIKYLGYDMITSSKICVKEFFPSTLCSRDKKTMFIRVNNGSEIAYREYAEEFLVYHRSVAKLKDQEGFVSLINIFHENNTVYAVAEWEDSITLMEFISRSGGTLEWDKVYSMFMPIMLGFDKMNEVGIHHLAINPKNIIILKSGKLKLMGFCIESARKVNTDLKPELYDGYSAYEQYVPEWVNTESTDVYSFSACLFYALTGKEIKSATRRKNDKKLLINKQLLQLIPPHVIKALVKGLQIEPGKRTQTFAELRENLTALNTIPINIESEFKSESTIENKTDENIHPRKLRSVITIIISCLIALALLFTLSLFVLDENQREKIFKLQRGNYLNSTITSSNVSTLQESTDENLIFVPNLVGKEIDDYDSGIYDENSDYQVLISSEEFSDTVDIGTIISQIPEYTPKARMQKGSIIAVVVSKGSETRYLPYIEGLDLTDASKKITDEGLVPYKETEQYSSMYTEGKVIGYSDGKKPGDSVKYGEKVGLVLSLGQNFEQSS